MARRRPLRGVQQAGVKIALTLEAIANMGRFATAHGSEGVIVDHVLVGDAIRYRVRVRRVGFVWWNADNIILG